MLIEEIINEWFGYKGIVSDIMGEYKLEIKKKMLFKIKFIFNIFLFFCLLLVYQLKDNYIYMYNYISNNFWMIFNLILSVPCIVLIIIILSQKQIDSKNKLYYYIVLIISIILIYSLKKNTVIIKSTILTILIRVGIIIWCIYTISNFNNEIKKFISKYWKFTLFVIITSSIVLESLIFLFQFFIIAVFEYENEKVSGEWWFNITATTIACFMLPFFNWEIPVMVILFKLLHHKYEKYKDLNESNAEIKKYKLFTLNHMFEDFYENSNKIYRITSHIYFCWMYFQLIYYLFKLGIINNILITFFSILYLIVIILLDKLFDKIKNNTNYVIFYFIIITPLYYSIIRKNIKILLFFIFLNILIFIIYFCVSFIKSNQRKNILKENMRIRETILLNIIKKFEVNNNVKYETEILKSLLEEINKKILFLKTVKWGFIIYILFQVISRYLDKDFDFKNLKWFGELNISSLFDKSMIFLLFVTGIFIVSQIIEKLLPYKLMELIYLNETINNLLLKEQKKGLKNVKKI